MLLAALFTTMGTIFVAELTDKDALFLLALATKTKASVVFARRVGRLHDQHRR